MEKQKSNKKNKLPENFFEQEKVWDEISKVWKGYRNYPISEVINFLNENLIEKNIKVLDLCCGSGRNLVKIKGTYYCVDFSKQMLNYAKEKSKELGVKAFFNKNSAESLPFDNNFFDTALFIDSLHCIKGSKSREKAVKELFRVLKPEKKALIRIWDKEQEIFKNKDKEIYIPWKINEKVCNRYYYLYDKNELVELLKKSGFEIICILEKEKQDKLYRKNISVIVKKA